MSLALVPPLARPLSIWCLTVTVATATLVGQGAAWQVRDDGAVIGMAVGAVQWAGDFDGDGRDDYLLRTLGEVRSGVDGAVLGMFPVPFFGAQTVRDVDGDGVRELLLHDFTGLQLLSGATGASLWSRGGTSHVQVVGDLDLDGYDDIAAARILLAGLVLEVSAISGRDGADLLWTVTVPTHLFVPTRTEIAPLGDVDGDDRADFAVAHFDGLGTSTLVMVSGAGTAMASVALTGIGDFENLAAADLDGDGAREALVQGSSGQLEAYSAAGALVGGRAVGATLELVGAGDIDGDRHEDVLVVTAPAGPGGPQVAVLHGPDLGSCSAGLPLTAVASGPGAGDSDDDGFADVLGLANGAVVLASRRVALYGVAGAVEGRGPIVSLLGDIDGDLAADFAVGSPDLGVLPAAGQVDFYSGAAVAPTGIAELGALAGDRLGASLAAFPDLVNAGQPAVLVGAPSAQPAAFVRLRDPLAGASYSRVGQQPTDAYGASIAAAGDVNGDGFEDLVVGAPVPGYVEIVSGAFLAAQIGPEVLHLELGAAPYPGIGYAVAGAGDVNGDGFADVLFSDPFGAAGAGPGKVFVLSGEWVTTTLSSGTPSTPRYLHEVVGLAADDEFGAAVAGVGDGNGDGVPDFAIGAPGADDGAAVDAGAVRVHSGLDGTELWSVASAAGARAGAALARTGDLDADGCDELLVGLPGFGLDRGRVEAWSIGRDRLVYARDGRAPGDRYGVSVSGGADTDGDGVPDLLVGAAAGAVGGGPYVELLRGQAPWPMTRATQYGAGCPDAAGTQARIGHRGAAALGEQLVFTLDGAPPGGFALRLLGFFPLNSTSPLFPGCTSLVQSSATTFVLPNAAGAGSSTLPIPNDPRFLGVELYAQWLVFSSTLSSSAGLRVTVGARPRAQL